MNTYVSLGNRGQLFFTLFNASVVQKETQSQTGGMTELYRDNGTYIKSFYTVMNAPSCTIVYMMGEVAHRLHHKINWPCAVPVIIDESYRKPDPVKTII